MGIESAKAFMTDSVQNNAISKAKLGANSRAKSGLEDGMDFGILLSQTRHSEPVKAKVDIATNSAGQKDLSAKVYLDEVENNSDEQTKDLDEEKNLSPELMVNLLNNISTFVNGASTNAQDFESTIDGILGSSSNNGLAAQSVLSILNASNDNAQNGVNIAQLADSDAQLIVGTNQTIEANVPTSDATLIAQSIEYITSSDASNQASQTLVSPLETVTGQAQVNNKSLSEMLGLLAKPSGQAGAKQPSSANASAGTSSDLSGVDNIAPDNSVDVPSSENQSNNGQGLSPDSNNPQFAPNVPNSSKINKSEALAAKIENQKVTTLVSDNSVAAIDQSQVSAQNTIDNSSALTQTTDAPHINMHALAATITRKHLNGDKSIFVRLDPAELGAIRVELKFGADKKLSAVISAEKIEALNELSNNSANLLQSLRDSGLDVADNAIEFKFDSNPQEQSQPQNWASESQKQRNNQSVARQSNIDAEAEIDSNAAKATTPHLEIWKRTRVSIEA